MSLRLREHGGLHMPRCKHLGSRAREVKCLVSPKCSGF